MYPIETAVLQRLKSIQREMYPTRERSFVVKNADFIKSYFIFEIFGGKLIVEHICKQTGGRPKSILHDFHCGSFADTLFESLMAVKRSREEEKDLRRTIKSKKKNQAATRL
jgi:hypothetical protein